MTAADHRPRVAAERRHRMRARLMAAGLALAAQVGPERLTVDALTAAAGVSRGSFYKYFDGPEALVRALAAALTRAVLEAIHPVVLASSDNVAARTATGIRTTLRLVKANPLLGAFMVRSGWPASEHMQGLFSGLAADIARGIALGHLTRLPAPVAVNLVTGTLLAAMHVVTLGGDSTDFETETASAVLRGLGVPAESAHALASAPLQTPAFDLNGLLQGHGLA